MKNEGRGGELYEWMIGNAEVTMRFVWVVFRGLEKGGLEGRQMEERKEVKCVVKRTKM